MLKAHLSWRLPYGLACVSIDFGYDYKGVGLSYHDFNWSHSARSTRSIHDVEFSQVNVPAFVAPIADRVETCPLMCLCRPTPSSKLDGKLLSCVPANGPNNC